MLTSCSRVGLGSTNKNLKPSSICIQNSNKAHFGELIYIPIQLLTRSIQKFINLVIVVTHTIYNAYIYNTYQVSSKHFEYALLTVPLTIPAGKASELYPKKHLEDDGQSIHLKVGAPASICDLFWTPKTKCVINTTHVMHGSSTNKIQQMHSMTYTCPHTYKSLVLYNVMETSYRRFQHGFANFTLE